ncbi:MAG: hypothetical protein LBT18_04345 [Endomicrobium sp.]|jgi:hypothetical protein|nr:hypothetical protein [Endomicrobium sp.]
MKKNIVFLLFFSLIIICGILYPLTEFLSKDKAKDLETLIVEKAKSAVKVIVPSFNKALESSDDISLLINAESVSKIENITACFVLNKNSRVIIHNNTSEWNTEKNSKIYNKALEQRTELLQQTPDKNLLLFSEPLMDDCTLFCTFSIQKAKETAKYWKIKYYAITSSVALFIIVIFYFLSKLLILLPFNRIKKTLEQTPAEDIKKGGYNEITDIFVTEKEKLIKKIETLKENRESLSKIIEYSQETAIKNSLAFIILNSLNEIVYAYDNTGKILKKDFEKNVHILEISKNPNLVKIVAEANENPGKEINDSLNNYTITAISINADDKIVGTIIKIK